MPNIFWDFDGVIKDSLDVKAEAFAALFSESQNAEFVNRIREHHYLHGGVSRTQKIRTYLGWLTEEVCEKSVDLYCQKFSQLVIQEVIQSDWVAGIESYLRSNPYKQTFYLVSATPQKELEKIVTLLKLGTVFRSIVGAPEPKIKSIKKTILDYKLNPLDCLMIGDSLVDYEAAIDNNISFILRRHKHNADIFNNYSGPYIEDFLNL